MIQYLPAYYSLHVYEHIMTAIAVQYNYVSIIVIEIDLVLKGHGSGIVAVYWLENEYGRPDLFVSLSRGSRVEPLC